MMPRWHHSVSMYGHIGEHIYAKTFCADYFFGLHPKSSFGNQTKKGQKLNSMVAMVMELFCQLYLLGHTVHALADSVVTLFIWL